MDFSVEQVVQSNSLSLVKRLIETSLVQPSQDTLKITQLDEIGDGNLNIVFRVMLNIGCSVIVKYAPPYIKILGPSFPLTQERLDVEYAALQTYHNLAPKCVPIPLLFDKQNTSIIMEDLKGWRILRDDLMEGKIDVEAIKDLMVSVATVHNSTSMTSCTVNEHAKLCETFSNKDMVEVTEQYVFVKPFTKDDPTNNHNPILNVEVERLRGDERCQKRAEEMRRVFVECKECFCHGDLHTGSVMTNGGQSKMFDIEFALMGPATFDLGTFLANLLFALIRQHVLKNTVAMDDIKQAIQASLDSYLEVYRIKTNVEEFTCNVCGFIGCELIRRVIGAAHVSDLSALPDGELIALVLGQAFLSLDKENYSQKLVDIIQEILIKNEL